MKALYFKEHGDSEQLHYGELDLPVLREGWVRVKVHAVALNHLDIWIRRGWAGLKLPKPHITGADVCGEIAESSSLTSELKIGQRVVVYPGIYGQEDEYSLRGEPSVSPNYQVLGEHIWGGLAEYVDVPVNNIQPVSDDSDVTALAAPNLVVTTAWRMLFTRGNLKKEHSVLIVGSGGGVNIVSAQIARTLGCRVIVLAGGEAKAKQVRALGFEEVISYIDTPDWHREVHRLTARRGVDLVVDNVGEASFQKSLKSLARGGRLVTVGNTTGFNIEIDNRLIFGKQISILGSTMGSLEDWRAGVAFLRDHSISIPLDGLYPLSDGRLQLERMEQGEHFGKIVLIP